MFFWKNADLDIQSRFGFFNESEEGIVAGSSRAEFADFIPRRGITADRCLISNAEDFQT
jgi:hypothetical protein